MTNSSDYSNRIIVKPKSLSRTLGGARRDRTDDLKLAKLPLSQLSYGPGQAPSSDKAGKPRPIMVGLGGLEPPTSRLSSARSNQLSYKPEITAPQELDMIRRPWCFCDYPERKRNEDGDIPQFEV